MTEHEKQRTASSPGAKSLPTIIKQTLPKT